MKTTLQAWGNSQGIRLPKALITQLGIEKGAELEVELSPKKDAIILTPTQLLTRVRERYRIEGLIDAMPLDYQAELLDWGTEGREVW